VCVCVCVCACMCVCVCQGAKGRDRVRGRYGRKTTSDHIIMTQMHIGIELSYVQCQRAICVLEMGPVHIRAEACVGEVLHRV